MTRTSPLRARWGRRRRAVSPIIAMILLVAITVVLAAILYELVSGLLRGPTTSTPGGLAFGATALETGTSSTIGCLSGHMCYTIQIAAISPGIGWDRVVFSVHSTGGAPIGIPGGSITILGTNGSAIPGVSCTLGARCTGPTLIATSNVIVLDTGIASPSPNTMAGDLLVASFEAPFSGSAQVALR